MNDKERAAIEIKSYLIWLAHDKLFGDSHKFNTLTIEEAETILRRAGEDK